MLERIDDVPVEVLVSPLALANEHGSAAINADEIDLGLLTQLGVVAPLAPEVAELVNRASDTRQTGRKASRFAARQTAPPVMAGQVGGWAPFVPWRRKRTRRPYREQEGRLGSWPRGAVTPLPAHARRLGRVVAAGHLALRQDLHVDGLGALGEAGGAGLLPVVGPPQPAVGLAVHRSFVLRQGRACGPDVQGRHEVPLLRGRLVPQGRAGLARMDEPERDWGLGRAEQYSSIWRPRAAPAPSLPFRARRLCLLCERRGVSQCYVVKYT